MTERAAGTDFFENNFDLIRLLAASSVALGHIADWSIKAEYPTTVWLISYVPGVPIFFFMSGYLVSASWERSSDIIGYSVNRALRIFPALWLSFTFSVLALLIFFGRETAANWPTFLVWIGAQLTLFQAWNPAFLRGYGTGVVNMALWTIPI